MNRMLPLLLDWLSQSADPDLGLLGLRTLATGTHRREHSPPCAGSPPKRPASCACCWAPGPACPGLRPTTGPDGGPGHRRGSGRREPGRLDDHVARSLTWRTGAGAVERGLRIFVRAEMLRISGHVLDLSGVDTTRAGPSPIWPRP